MIFRQILHPQTGCASYVFGCTGKAKLAVVDPHIDHIADYLEVARQANSPIVAIFETHVQADHHSGAALLAAATSAPIYLHESAQVTFPFTPLKDGDVVELGNDYVHVLHTPGHSADSVSLVVGDKVRTEAPWLVFTGDTLFVGDVGRPDLHGDANTALFAGQLYDSLFGKLLTLEDTVEIYPSHFAGSICGRAMSGKPSSTIGFERRFNPALQHTDREAFIAFVQKDQAPAPPEFTTIREANLNARIGELA
ncbi:MAG TPA: MBL fold metallo-hydrolase [Aggregatilineales bacterium]|nr:MBL fold metallo-hydrolase [Aggregatilineales bacterium]